MPQNPIAGYIAQNPTTKKAVPLIVDGKGGLVTSSGDDFSALGITTATVVNVGAGRAVRLSVIVAGSAAGGVYDTTTTGSVAASNQIAVAPNTVGVITLEFPYLTGLVVVPGTGQTLAIAYL